MLSLRLPEPLIERIDRLAADEGVDRTEWCAQRLSRAALTSSAAPRTIVGSNRPQADESGGADD